MGDKIKIVDDPIYDEDEPLEEQQSLTNKSFLMEEYQKGYLIPAWLSHLQTVSEGNKQFMSAVPNKRSEHIIKPTSPKYSVHNAFGSQDESEEDDDMENDAKLDVAYVLEQKTDYVFHMVDGVVHVYAHKAVKEILFPITDATTFSTDSHHILRVLAVGNIRTLCHHRLNLLAPYQSDGTILQVGSRGSTQRILAD